MKCLVKNKVMKAKIIFTLFLFYSLNIFSQQNIYPVQLDCFNIDGINITNGVTLIENERCLQSPGATNTLNLNGTKEVDFISSTEVHLKPGFSAYGFNGNGYFHASVIKSEIPLVVFTPENTNGEVGKYDKLEIGVRLPQNVYDEIDNFINEIPNVNKLNPFNESDINVIADFYTLTGNNLATENFKHTVYGYYHNEYKTVIETPANAVNSYYEKDTTSFRFRVRFAPWLIGYWKCKIRVEINGHGILYSKSFNFKCVPSSTNAYMQKGTNNYFFTLNNNTYMPIGQNLVWPRCDENGDCEQFGNLGIFENSGSGYQSELNNPITYLHFRNKMEVLRNSGANFFRMLFAPWSVDLEFENIGNYTSPNINKDRMRCAWEMDKIVDKAKELDLNFSLNLDVHYMVEEDSENSSWDWDWPSDHCGFPDIGNCYQEDLGLQEPLEFLTSPVAQNYWKQKLRYIISRWGYSTNIAMFEMFSEINNLGAVFPTELVNNDCLHTSATDEYKRYETNPAYPEAVENWHEIMTDYIKNTLGHNQHLLSTSYTGNDRLSDASYNLPNIDIVNYNFYSASPVRYNDAVGSTKSLHNLYDKPVMWSESGSPSLDGCSNFTEWLRNAWIAPFTGTAASLNWSGDFLQQNNLWTEFGKIRNFIESIDFDGEGWGPVTDKRDDNKASLFALKYQGVNENNKAIGVIVNNTWNFYTAKNGSVNECDKPINANFVSSIGCELPISLYQPGEGNSNELHLENMGFVKEYRINFYYRDGTEIQGSSITKFSSLSGNLNVEYPFDWEATESSAIILFKAFPTGSSFLPEVTQENIVSISSIEKNVTGITLSNKGTSNSSLEIFLSPNPAKDACILTIPEELSKNNCILEIYNAIGELKSTIQINTASLNVSLAGYKNGIYLFVIKDGNNLYTQKLIVNEN